MSDNLESLSSDELNKLFATEIAGPQFSCKEGNECYHECLAHWEESIRDYTRSASAVMPELEKAFIQFQWSRDDFTDKERGFFTARNAHHTCFGALSTTFARGAVIVLLKEKRSRTQNTSLTEPERLGLSVGMETTNATKEDMSHLPVLPRYVLRRYGSKGQWGILDRLTFSWKETASNKQEADALFCAYRSISLPTLT